DETEEEVEALAQVDDVLRLDADEDRDRLGTAAVDLDVRTERAGRRWRPLQHGAGQPTTGDDPNDPPGRRTRLGKMLRMDLQRPASQGPDSRRLATQQGRSGEPVTLSGCRIATRIAVHANLHGASVRLPVN